ncbi:MAG: TetR/AcrR family transcriptional regulator [Gemmobacter sp.]
MEDPKLVERRREQIVSAATKLFSDRGFYKTTIKDIAKLAGISPGLVYLYVREKEDVLLLVLLQVVDAYAREIPKAIEGVTDPLDRLTLAVDAYCRVVDRHRSSTVLAYRSTKSLSPERRLLIQERELATNSIICDALTACIEQGLVRPVNVDVLSYQLVLVAHGWALKSWFFKSRLTLDEYIVASLDNVLAGILTEDGRCRRQSQHADRQG